MQFSRRGFLAASGTGLALSPLPAWAQGHGMAHGGSHRLPKGPLIPPGFGVLTGKDIDLTVADGLREVAGRRGLGLDGRRRSRLALRIASSSSLV